MMGLYIAREIAASIKSSRFFTIMADEVTDVSNKEQVVICFRSIDENFEAHEDFIGLHTVDSIKADNLVRVLKDAVLRMNLDMKNCRGQCYNGAANMSGAKHGTSTQIQSEEPKAIFIHCFGHALNLAVADTVKKNRILRDTLDTVFEISRLLKFSPCRDAMFTKLKADLCPDVPGFRTLCPTRWMVKAASMESVVENYAVFQALWEEAKDAVRDSETHARIGGVNCSHLILVHGSQHQPWQISRHIWSA